MMDGMGGGWWMGAGSLVFILLIVIVGVLLVRHPDESRSRRTSEAADILAQRFARGEIDEEEYRSRVAALRR